jgi:manganese efflux pump family protein
VIAKILALVLPLGLDTFAVSAAIGLRGVGPRERLRISLLFSGFEAAMPLIGLAAGRPLGSAIGAGADYLAIAVLAALGLYLLLGEDEDEQRIAGLADRSGVAAIALGVSISLDELAIGFTFGLLRLPVLPVIVLIAVQTFLVTQLGLRLGARLGAHARERAERLAGAALTTLAVVLLVERVG